jgi:peptidyl-prolyl cis-trans isomerase SurA
MFFLKNKFLLFAMTLLIPLGVFSQQPGISPDARNQAKQKLQRIKDRITKGENFNTLAIMYSDDQGTSANGGCHDSLKRGFFLPAVDSVAFRLKPGELSEVFETIFGFEIVLCKARRGEEMDFCHILIRP